MVCCDEPMQVGLEPPSLRTPPVAFRSVYTEIDVSTQILCGCDFQRASPESQQVLALYSAGHGNLLIRQMDEYDNVNAMGSIERLVKFGLSEQKAKETAANKKLTATIDQILDDVNYLMILNSEAAIKYAEANKEINAAAFDTACGVGVVVSDAEIKAAVAKHFSEKLAEIQSKRYQSLGSILAALRTGNMRWANAATVKKFVDEKLLEVLGPKDDRDSGKKKEKAPKEAKEAATPAAPPAKPSIAELARSPKFVFEGALAQLHKPGENPQIKPELMVEHLKRTKGKVITRFPPEPNGFLHIGHAKALNINFGYAAAHNGITYLRYDDTNPEAEEEIYFTSILETVEWLGFKPYAITYSSDHFQRLFDLAVDLIKRDKAYVCHCTGEEIHKMRGGDEKGPRSECKHRNRPIEESVKEFYRMKNGEYAEGEAILRMKMDMFHPSPQFWDLVAYRVLYSAHHRTGDAWCIYPTYDYTHCLCDSFEDITHSLCTTEFTLSRESYYWLVDALEIYKPVQWEYGRLNLTYAVLSKRKLLKLTNDKIVDGWDDPRLYTLMALRRRGFTPEAISAFCREIGVTTANTVIPVERLENYVRDHLNEIAPRIMALLEPVKVTITNLPDNHLEYIELQNNPKDKSMGSHKVPFTKTLYIDASDFKEEADQNFFRLTKTQAVGLLNVPHPISVESVVKDASGKVTELKVKYHNTGPSIKPKTYIQWIAHSPKDKSPVNVEIRMYENLFLHPNPFDKTLVPGGWMSDINPNSLSIVSGMAEVGLLSAKMEEKFQFVRIGYFCVDKLSDLKKGKIVVNRTVSLKEDSGKQ
ncbi:hypothetical protein HDU96_006616 [Phlyctochytrium bullatum]|nr:hypothetical protein HDU96_006616 [Phlyctochytrium bullatum]